MDISEGVTPDFVKALDKPADNFLCKLSDNWA